ncbi:hypothetical protein VNO80_27782 [Phaseolus coccineus]|uniref:Uncharacterized protein n=1 Tax=Phaseolus coccineus TaxID=3886 RepID=A0AAN9LH05_PHACN
MESSCFHTTFLSSSTVYAPYGRDFLWICIGQMEGYGMLRDEVLEKLLIVAVTDATPKLTVLLPKKIDKASKEPNSVFLVLLVVTVL